MTEPQPIDDTLLGLIAAQRLVVRLHVRRGRPSLTGVTRLMLPCGRPAAMNRRSGILLEREKAR